MRVAPVDVIAEATGVPGVPGSTTWVAGAVVKVPAAEAAETLPATSLALTA